MKRTLAVLAGILVLLLGVAAAALGGAVLSYFGTEGRHDVPVAEVRTEGAALYVRAFGLDQELIPEGTFDVTLSASAPSGEEVFLGVGRAEDVQKYLTGVPYDAGTELVDGAFVTNQIPGLRVPAPPPGEQEFWVAQASGSPADLTWSPSYRLDVLVAMNADGSAPVEMELNAALVFERAFLVMAVAFGGALLLWVLAWWLLVRAGRKRAPSDASAG